MIGDFDLQWEEEVVVADEDVKADVEADDDKELVTALFDAEEGSKFSELLRIGLDSSGKPRFFEPATSLRESLTDGGNEE